VQPKASSAGLICRICQYYAISDGKATSGKILGDQPKEGIDSYGGKDFEIQIQPQIQSVC